MCIFQERNAFLVTNVLIPNQKGAPDSCDLLHEEELYKYADKHELLQLGWIHVRSSILSAVQSIFTREIWWSFYHTGSLKQLVRSWLFSWNYNHLIAWLDTACRAQMKLRYNAAPLRFIFWSFCDRLNIEYPSSKLPSYFTRGSTSWNVLAEFNYIQITWYDLISYFTDASDTDSFPI